MVEAEDGSQVSGLVTVVQVQKEEEGMVKIGGRESKLPEDS